MKTLTSIGPENLVLFMLISIGLGLFGLYQLKQNKNDYPQYLLVVMSLVSLAVLAFCLREQLS